MKTWWWAVAVLAIVPLALGQPREKSPERKLHDEIADSFRPGQPPFIDQITADSPNAAARYIWLCQNLDKSLVHMAGAVDHSMPVLTIAKNDEGLTAAALEARLVRSEGWADALIEATRLDICDFHESVDPRGNWSGPTDPRRGLSLKLRDAARILAADAISNWGAGRRARAVDEVVAMFDFAGHIAAKGERRVIECFVAGAIVRMAGDVTGAFLNDPDSPLTQAECARIRESAERLPVTDPFGIRVAWNRERRLMARFAEEQLAGGDIGTALAIDLGEFQSMRLAVNKEAREAVFGQGEAPGFRLTSRDHGEILEKLRAIMPGVTRDDLSRRLAIAKRLGDEIDQHWFDADAEDRCKDAQALSDADPTMITAYGLGFGAIGYHDTWQKDVERLATIKARLVHAR